MTPDTWIQMAGNAVVVLVGFGARQLKANRDNVRVAKANDARHAEIKQLSDTRHAENTERLLRIEIQTTKTNGTVGIHGSRLDRLDDEIRRLRDK